MFNIVITFVVIMLGVFIASLAYSKAYKVKNKIIDILEENGTMDVEDSIDEIDGVLIELGYNENRDRECTAQKGGEIYNSDGLDYCIEKIETTGNKSGNFYYRVTTYMHLDIPLVGELLSPPITGESKVIYSTYYNTDADKMAAEEE